MMPVGDWLNQHDNMTNASLSARGLLGRNDEVTVQGDHFLILIGDCLSFQVDTDDVVSSFTQAEVDARKIGFELKADVSSSNEDVFKFTIGLAGEKQQIKVTQH